LTASCGFGYQGQCCCECALHLVARPRCHHLGGVGFCEGPYPSFEDPSLVVIAKEGERARRKAEHEKEHPVRYVCLAFADEGIAQTDWNEHGSCEMWTPKKNQGT